MVNFFKNILLNLSFFFILIIIIQNSNTKNKVDLIFEETINLPLSFIVGTSFISGSIIGSFFSTNFLLKNSTK